MDNLICIASKFLTHSAQAVVWWGVLLHHSGHSWFLALWRDGMF